MYWSLSLCSRHASNIPLMPSPGRLNTVSTPHSSRRRISRSATVLAIVVSPSPGSKSFPCRAASLRLPGGLPAPALFLFVPAPSGPAARPHPAAAHTHLLLFLIARAVGRLADEPHPGFLRQVRRRQVHLVQAHAGVSRSHLRARLAAVGTPAHGRRLHEFQAQDLAGGNR